MQHLRDGQALRAEVLDTGVSVLTGSAPVRPSVPGRHEGAGPGLVRPGER
ncbi:hypothetical protein [Streptomyces sp. HUAS TT20]|nr:hypothetical protein [Streptomyces sp. HUAS 15-9]UXY25941.1 hypothetical protein N8I87_04680 [Streptomyces sp. HUAS 15-9]